VISLTTLPMSRLRPRRRLPQLMMRLLFKQMLQLQHLQKQHNPPLSQQLLNKLPLKQLKSKPPQPKKQLQPQLPRPNPLLQQKKSLPQLQEPLTQAEWMKFKPLVLEWPNCRQKWMLTFKLLKIREPLRQKLSKFNVMIHLVNFKV